MKVSFEDMSAALRALPDSKTLDDLKFCINQVFPIQVKHEIAIAPTGEEYVKFHAYAFCRPEPVDMMLTEISVVEQMGRLLRDYLECRDGPLYWRVKLEGDWSDAERVIQHHISAPDYDPNADRQCWLDRRWKKYAIYTRLLRSDKTAADKTGVEAVL